MYTIVLYLVLVLMDGFGMLTMFYYVGMNSLKERHENNRNAIEFFSSLKEDNIQT